MISIRTSGRRNDWRDIAAFLQRMANRLGMGSYRHEKGAGPDAAQDYLRRARYCLDQYDRTGSLELLVDAANYCYLESATPLHGDATWESKDSGGRTARERF